MNFQEFFKDNFKKKIFLVVIPVENVDIFFIFVAGGGAGLILKKTAAK
jgi:hypothetical protein